MINGSSLGLDVIASNPSCASVSGVLFNKTLTTLILYPEGRTGGYVIPASVTSIGPYAFPNCPWLSTVTIPGSVTTIGEQAFGSCSSLTTIGVRESNPSYASVSGILFNKALTIR